MSQRKLFVSLNNSTRTIPGYAIQIEEQQKIFEHKRGAEAAKALPLFCLT
jgi:hypothetical protein